MIAYLRVTEGPTSHVRWHLCWDSDLFVKTLRDALTTKQQKGKASKDDKIEVITEEEYRAAKWPDAPGRAQS